MGYVSCLGILLLRDRVQCHHQTAQVGIKHTDETADGGIQATKSLGHQHLLIIRTIENADISPLGQAAVDENQKPTEAITINSVSIETYQ